jgi:hypothetical protein
MKVTFTLPFLTIDFIINLGRKVLLDLVLKTFPKLISELPSKA